MSLTRRLQVLVEQEQYARLERLAQRRGVPVARVVREAIDIVVPTEGLDRSRAAELLLAAEPMPVDDWPVLKAEIEGRFDGRSS